MRKLKIDYSKYINKHYGICVVLQYLGYKNINGRNRPFFLVTCKCGRKWEARVDSLWRLQSCGRCLAWQEGHAAFSELYGTYKKRAIARFGSFELTKEEFKEITKSVCYYCGAAPANIAKKKCHNGAYVYNGIDRFDNKRGYMKDNSFPCCKTCNYAKRNLTFEQFNEWVQRLKVHNSENCERRNFKFVPTQSLFFDIDDTLVLWPPYPETFENNPESLIFNYNNHNFYLKPNTLMIKELKEKYKEGFEIIIWSYGSKEWAKEVIEKLGLNNFVDYITSKPDFYYDDKDASEYLESKRKYIK